MVIFKFFYMLSFVLSLTGASLVGLSTLNDNDRETVINALFTTHFGYESLLD